MTPFEKLQEAAAAGHANLGDSSLNSSPQIAAAKEIDQFLQDLVRYFQVENGNTKSCGCFRASVPRNKWWKGFGELSGRYWGQIKRGAFKRKLDFLIDIEYAWNLFLQQERECAMTEIPIYFAETGRKKGTASLDRIDSSKGYIKGNVWWVHKDVNLAKSFFELKHFVSLCECVAKCRNKILNNALSILQST